MSVYSAAVRVLFRLYQLCGARGRRYVCIAGKNRFFRINLQTDTQSTQYLHYHFASLSLSLSQTLKLTHTHTHSLTLFLNPPLSFSYAQVAMGFQNCTCNITVTIPKTLDGTVYMYYGLTNFYQVQKGFCLGLSSFSPFFFFCRTTVATSSHATTFN